MKYLFPFLFLATPAAAEFSMTEGSYFVLHGDYDHKTNTYIQSQPEGSETACYQITAVAEDRASFDVVLISGTHTPWWSDETLHPGFTNTYVDYPDGAWRKQNPDGDWHVFISNLLKTVPDCPAEGS